MRATMSSSPALSQDVSARTQRQAATRVFALAIATVAVVSLIAWPRGGVGGGPCDPRRVAEKAMPSVVTIFVNSSSGSAGNGSGEFLDREGHILTNNHVISPAVGGGLITVLRPNGEELTATLVGRDPQTDLAVLKVDPVTPVSPVTFGSAPPIGAQVFAIGAPMGLSDTFTAGVVSGLDRSVRVPSDDNTTALLVAAIQTDTAINPGNSGGMLADCRGDLVGVPTAGATANDSRGVAVAGNIGLGFAVPAASARRIADGLIADGRVDHGDFGISVVPISSARSTVSPSGLHIASVIPNGPAAQAGLKEGDIITALDGRLIAGADQLQELALSRTPGQRVEVAYQRDGTTGTITLTLGRHT
jgi:putative serine protease PepD